MPLGAHVSISGGLYKAPFNGRTATCEVVQIFTQSRNQWRTKALTHEDVVKFITAQQETGVKVVCAHDSYLINLASPEKVLFKKSYTAFLEEMNRCNRLQIPYLVMHPGAHVGTGETKGIDQLARALNRLLDKDPKGQVKICLETTAGQGTSLGYRLEQLAEILDKIENRERMAICLDTCHIFAAGYRFHTRKAYHALIREFDNVLGLAKLAVIHMNDSKKECGSRVDRHEHIGRGAIGAGPFGFFMNDKRLAKIPKILETPKKSAAEDIANLKVLRGLVKKGRRLT